MGLSARLQQHCHPLLGVWVGDNLLDIMDNEVSSGLWLICEIPKCPLMRNYTFQPLDNSHDHHNYLYHLEETDINVLHTLGIYQICNELWQYPLCNIKWLSQSDELHQLLLGLVKDILNLLLKYLNARNV